MINIVLSLQERQNIFQGEYIVSKYDYFYLTDGKTDRNSINDLPNSSNSWFPNIKASLEIIIPISQLPLPIFKISPFNFSDSVDKTVFLNKYGMDEKKKLIPWLK